MNASSIDTAAGGVVSMTSSTLSSTAATSREASPAWSVIPARTSTCWRSPAPDADSAHRAPPSAGPASKELVADGSRPRPQPQTVEAPEGPAHPAGLRGRSAAVRVWSTDADPLLHHRSTRRHEDPAAPVQEAAGPVQSSSVLGSGDRNPGLMNCSSGGHPARRLGSSCACFNPEAAHSRESGVTTVMVDV